ncbi:PAS domain S-box protein [Phenylobacterium sp.]|uniref:PAS domain-containing hybrid sensor histidine kinase/response regulator n=1 Tax=Phenylobacterium sp. TaxID=1871053 RepID=UPI00286DC546|nr:PAS domain S-box protein [Phenylobacterium sp.]
MYASGEINRPATDADVFRLLVEASTDIIVRTGLDGLLTYVSPACRTLGYEPEQLVGRSATALVHPNDLDRHLANTAKLLKGAQIDRGGDRAHRYRAGDGTWVWLEGNPQILRDDSGRPVEILNAFRDVTARKHAEAVLADARKKEADARAQEHAQRDLFENAFHHAPIGMALVGLDGAFLKLNRAFCEIVGYGEPELLALDFQAITHPDDLDADLGHLARLVAGEIPSYRMNKRYIRKDGATVWVGLSVSQVCDTDGRPKHFVAQVQDLTARREAEDRYRLLADASTDVVLKVDMNDVIQYISPSARRYGFEPDDLIGRRGAEFIHSDDLKRVLATVGEVAAGGTVEASRDRSLRMRTRDGYVWVEANTTLVRDDDGAPIALVSQMRDVTERRAAYAALAEAEAKFRLMAENATDMIVTTDLEGAITFAAPSSRAITGYDSSALIGLRPLELTHPDDAADVLRVFTNVAMGRQGEAVRWRVWHKHEERWVWLESNPSLLHGDRPLEEQMFLDVIRDVTLQVAQEAALAAATVAAEAAAAAKAEFLANMSHEIRTPLTAILGFTGLLAARQGLDEIARGHVERVAGAGHALLSIVNDVLDFSKLEAGQYDIKPRPVSPVQVAHDALLMFAPQAEAKGLALEFQADDGTPELLALDPDRLRQILLNLVGNAIKFTEEGLVCLRLSYDTGLERLHVAVQDSGVGLTPQQQAGLFQRFAQVDASSTRRHGGTGLGLAICKGLTEAMGGEIGVTGAPGRGSTFAFFIAAPEAKAPASAAEAGEPVLTLDGVRVLVVDDNPMNRELARAVLETVGAEVTQAGDGEQALQAALSLPYDVILLDIRMPIMDGPATLKRLRAEPGPNMSIPVLAFSADSDLERYAEEDGFDDVVRKPMNAVGLIQAIAHWTQWDPVSDEGASDADVA